MTWRAADAGVTDGVDGKGRGRSAAPCGGAVGRRRGVADHVDRSSRRGRRIAVVGGSGGPGGGRRGDCAGRLGRRTGRRGRGRTAPGRGRGFHGRPVRSRVGGVRPAVRRVPRAGAVRGGSAGPARGRLPERLGRADDGRVVCLPARRDAPRPRRLAHRRGLPGPRRLHPRHERRPPRRRAADGRRRGHHRGRRGHRRGRAGGARGRPAAPAVDAVRQPGGVARPGPGDRRAPRRPAAGRLAELAAHSRRPRLQPPRPGDARQRRRAAARLGARHPRGQPPDHAAGARRGDVPRQSGERRPGD